MQQSEERVRDSLAVHPILAGAGEACKQGDTPRHTSSHLNPWKLRDCYSMRPRIDRRKMQKNIWTCSFAQGSSVSLTLPGPEA